MNDYDVTCRALMRAYGAELVPWLLRLVAEQLKFVTWIESHMTEAGRTERVCDTIAWLLNLEELGEPWAVVIEFQAKPDPDMFGRLLEYLGSTYRLFRPSEEKGDRFSVGAVVVNLTGAGQSFRRVAWKNAGLGVALRGREWNLAAIDARKFIRQVEAGAVPRPALAFVPLMKRGGEPGTIQRWLQVASAEPDAKKRSDLALAEVFAALTSHLAAWQSALEGWNVNESPAVKRWKDEGRVEGRLEGRVEGRAQALVDLLEDTYGKLPKAVRSAVVANTDVTLFREWTRLIRKAESLEEFRNRAGI